jgi:hypothetical protein
MAVVVCVGVWSEQHSYDSMLRSMSKSLDVL